MKALASPSFAGGKGGLVSSRSRQPILCYRRDSRTASPRIVLRPLGRARREALDGRDEREGTEALLSGLLGPWRGAPVQGAPGRKPARSSSAWPSPEAR